MQILIVAATELEIQPIIASDPEMDHLVTGIGAPAAIYHLQKRLQQVDYDLVIQAGIAGSFSKEITPGQTVWVKQDCFADLGMEEKENFTPLFDSGLTNKNEFPFENGWLINRNELLDSATSAVVKAVTVNKVSDSELQKRQFIDHFDPAIESMEGAALHYVCLQEHVPFLQLRSISNYVGERDKAKWKLKDAINNLNDHLAKLITQLTN
ncbi:MAG TPA: futalosine hydrolase [Ferruginibacter sp.]|nr:futalosine hydrolase [Ferruginibacter sp.]